jgi:hypothetical protein
MPVNKVVFTVGPKIKLQELFDTDYKKAESSGLFCHTDGDVRKTRQCAQRLMLLSQVELSGKLISLFINECKAAKLTRLRDHR